MGAEQDKEERIVIAAIIFVASAAIASALVVVAYYCYLRFKLSHKHNKNLEGIQVDGLQVFTFKQIHSATYGFAKSNVIGHAAFGLVYRGVLQNVMKVAMKVTSATIKSRAGGRRSGAAADRDGVANDRAAFGVSGC